ncbi:hypothetical protein [Pseudomonas serboccidentalis]|uniref:hypothetical protein n=1 Tax=Pseudomonas serboccidentalis TaxID=2964670 RepID=UPI0039E1F116
MTKVLFLTPLATLASLTSLTRWMSVVGLLRDSGSTWRYYRTAADMVVRWALSEFNYGNVKIAEWFPDVTDKQRLLPPPQYWDAILDKQDKVSAWLRMQSLE